MATPEFAADAPAAVISAASATVSTAGDAAAGPRFNSNAAPFVPKPRPPEDGNVFDRLPPSHLQLLRTGFYSMNGEWVAYYVGTLKSFNNKSGYGFVACPQAKSDWASDVFIHKNYVPKPWHIGQPLEFAVTVNSRGQPQAVDINWLPRLPDSMGRPPMQIRNQMGASMPPSVSPAAVVASPPSRAYPSAGDADAASGVASSSADASGPPDRRIGKLKSFSSAQGYGFIACEDVFEEFKRDVYFDKSSMPNVYQFGQPVEFTMTFNARQQPQARTLNWDPVPRLPAEVGAPETPPSTSQKTLKDLRKLLKLLHEENRDTAVITAIDLQGGSGQASVEASEERVDYLTFVLNRLGKESVAIDKFSNEFTKMLLLLMLSKMLRAKLQQQQCRYLVTWFEATEASFDPIVRGDKSVQDHLADVLVQISNHLQSAQKENPAIVAGDTHDVLQAIFKRLEAKSKDGQKREDGS